jgi:hypothetical protein
MSEHESATAEWYYARNNRQEGPVGVEVLRRMLASGELRPTDLVWTSGMAEWKEARAVSELAPTRVEAERVAPPGGPGFPPPPSWGSTHAPPPPPQGGPAGAYGPVGYRPPVAPSQQGKAVAAFVCAMLGMVCCPFVIGVIPAVVALVLSSNALSAMKRTGNHEGEGLAKAGMIIAIVDLVLAAAALGVRIG